MKKKIILILLVTTILSCCKKKQTILNFSPSINLEVQNNFSCESIDLRTLKVNYKKNLDVSPNVSYYQYQQGKKYIQIETPVPNKNYKVLNAYYDNREIYSTIIIHITDNTSSQAREQSMSHLLKGKIKFKDLKNINPSLPSFDPIDSKKIVHVVIYNDDGTLNKFTRPDEAGGGVIVGNP
ncbi:hypothetical protein [Tenacibaculum ovolyticum]|uniref:hypothetical protein n=1 Tax=Tenacibaculum ovolyticum TaxID=104270 RepID=UPI0007ED9FC8|nr:hypothetical protein [Tenacibaculum ovolyticum]